MFYNLGACFGEVRRERSRPASIFQIVPTMAKIPFLGPADAKYERTLVESK